MPSSASTSTAELPARVVAPLLGRAGSTTTSRKSSRGGLRSLSTQDADDLRRPQELVLEVDEPLAPSAARARRPRGSGSRRAAGSRRPSRAPCGRPAPSSSRPAPAAATTGDVLPGRPPSSGRRSARRRRRRPGRAGTSTTSCHPRPPRTWCARGVEAVARQRREVDPADERDLAVDDHELLVVAVHRPLARVQLAADARPVHELVARGSRTARARLEQRHRRAGPQQHAHVRRARRPRRAASRSGRALVVARQPEAGVMCQPAMCTDERAPSIASAIRGSASAPSMSTSSEQPSRGGGSPEHHNVPSAGGLYEPECSSRASRRRW